MGTGGGLLSIGNSKVITGFAFERVSLTKLFWSIGLFADVSVSGTEPKNLGSEPVFSTGRRRQPASSFQTPPRQSENPWRERYSPDRSPRSEHFFISRGTKTRALAKCDPAREYKAWKIHPGRPLLVLCAWGASPGGHASAASSNPSSRFFPANCFHSLASS